MFARRKGETVKKREKKRDEKRCVYMMPLTRECVSTFNHYYCEDERQADCDYRASLSSGEKNIAGQSNY